jgi:predicted permease
MTTLWQDIRYAFRRLVKSPGLTAVAALSLVLGVTVNSAVFSLVDGIWLRSMPFADPGRVVRIFGSTPDRKQGNLSYPDYLDLREQMQSVAGLATNDRRGATLMADDEPQDLRADIVSWNFFDVLGIRPHLGRFFSEADEAVLKGTPTVVLSHRLWQRCFGADPNLVDGPIELTGRLVTVLGIAPPGFGGLERLNPADVWYPAEDYPSLFSRDERFLSVVGRLKPGATVQQTQAEAETIFRRQDLRDARSHAPLRALVQTEASVQFERTGSLGLLLLGTAATVLLLTCANVASLSLARAEVRAPEMAVHAALGGSRWRLVRQLLAESLLLALIATVLSLPLAHWLIAAWPAVLPPDAAVPIAQRVHWDGRVVVFTCTIALFSIVLFGLAPAWHASRPDLTPTLKGGQAWRTPGRRHGGLNFLVVGQTAVALVLVAVAGLLVRSLLTCYDADLGFEKKEILLVSLTTGNEEHGRMVHRQLRERVQALPGVKRVSVAFQPERLGGLTKGLPARPARVCVAGGLVRAVQRGRSRLLRAAGHPDLARPGLY